MENRQRLCEIIEERSGSISILMIKADAGTLYISGTADKSDINSISGTAGYAI